MTPSTRAFTSPSTFYDETQLTFRLMQLTQMRLLAIVRSHPKSSRATVHYLRSIPVSAAQKGSNRERRNAQLGMSTPCSVRSAFDVHDPSQRVNKLEERVGTLEASQHAQQPEYRSPTQGSRSGMDQRPQLGTEFRTNRSGVPGPNLLVRCC
ncbi:hypothetical protein OH77DRAFT_1427498 [Trametes cingulata]|nr:hypothetical protein OH77DRAFT_1427498 [Trametes cingulata]